MGVRRRRRRITTAHTLKRASSIPNMCVCVCVCVYAAKEALLTVNSREERGGAGLRETAAGVSPVMQECFEVCSNDVVM